MKYFVLLVCALSAPGVAAFESVDAKIGYGGAWFFFNETDSYAALSGSGSTSQTTNHIAVGDVLGLGADVRLVTSHAVSATLSFGGPYAYFSSLNFGTTYKFFPFEWYNQVFIGAGADYLRITYPYENQPAHRIGAHLAYGLNIRFPGNILIIVDFKNIFFAPVYDRSGNQELTHIFQLMGSVAYRFTLQGEPAKTPSS